MRRFVSLLISGALFLSLQSPAVAVVPSNQTATNVQVTATGVESGELSVSWSVPNPADVNDNFASYQAILRNSDGVIVNEGELLGSDRASSYLFTGLINGQVYRAEVRTNFDGETVVEVATLTATPYDVPEAPAKPTIARTAPGEILVDWAVPENNGNTISLYTVVCIPSCSGSTLTSVDSQLVITGLDSATSYTVSVIATNERGPSVTSLASNGLIPHAEVVPPTDLTITAGNQKIDASWSAASISGATVTGYVVELFRETAPGSVVQTLEVSTASARFTGLINDVSYFYKVSTEVGLLTSAPATSFAALTVAPVVLPPEVGPPAVIPVQPAAPAQPRLGLKKKLSAKSLAIQIGMTVTPKATIKLTVSRASKKICKVSSGKLVALKPGNCSVKVSVTPAKTKKIKKPKAITQSTVVVIF